tara:strand:- start:534 stop:698 length:165 start_codon:yes stop_codon:yes gene_type:complete
VPERQIKERETDMKDVPIDELGGTMVVDENGGDVPLGSLWLDRTAVLVFVRHFG